MSTVAPQSGDPTNVLLQKILRTLAEDSASGSVNWDDILGKPPTFPPEAHTHTPAEVGADPAGTASTAVAAHVAALNPHTVYQLLAEKGAVNGYASLDGSGKVPSGQLPTMSAGVILKMWTNSSAVSGSTTSVIPMDNTSPQNTEGAQIIDLPSVNPTSASSRVLVIASFWYTSHVNSPIAALFFDSDLSSVASTPLNTVPATNYTQQATVVFDLPSWTGARVLKLRAGPNFWGGTSAFYWNRLNTGDVLNSTSKTTITAIEYTP